MTSNLHYFKYHRNSLVYNTDRYLLISHPKIKKKNLFTIYIYKKNYSERQEHRRGTRYRL